MAKIAVIFIVVDLLICYEVFMQITGKNEAAVQNNITSFFFLWNNMVKDRHILALELFLFYIISSSLLHAGNQ